MNVRNLYLEVTRMCTLECEHCLRGNREKEFMSLETIRNVFSSVKEVDTLLITGGEPLIAIKQISEIIKAIYDNNVKVNEIILITNGTIISEKIINVLKELSKVGELCLRLSFDMFHYLELERLGLLKRRQDNAEIYKKLFNALDYGSVDEDKNKKIIIERIGRGLHLSQERMDEISRLSGVNYIFPQPELIPMLQDNDVTYDVSQDVVKGKISIDVYGNVTGYSLSFNDEDDEINKYSSNVNEIGLAEAIMNYIEYQNNNQKRR